MYASEMREQNDISLIIGHLPKRLREKIMPNWIHHGDVVSNIMKNRKSHHSKGFEQPCEKVVTPNDKVMNINYFLPTPLPLPVVGKWQYNALPVSESRGMTSSVQQSCESNADNNERIDTKNTLVTVPGVLYLKNPSTSIPKKNQSETTHVNNFLSAKNKHVKQNFYDDDINSPHKEFASVDKPVWMNDINDSYVTLIFGLHSSIKKMMSENKVIQNWTNFCGIRAELREVFLEVLMTYTKLCCEKKVDNFFWKVLYYNVREYLKQQPTNENTHFCIMSIIEDGLEFYQDLYEQLRTTYLTEKPNTKLSQYYNEKNILVAKVIGQRALISLGDLWRYKTKEIKSQDYTKAMKYYEQAQSLLPSNGIPYNQLALISIYCRQKFDAIYYYVRSLMSSSAILSARENLLILFDEIRKKYKETKFYASKVQNSDKPKASKTSKCIRKEIWIYPDGVRRLHRTNGYDNFNDTVDIEEQNLKKIHPKELSKHFTFLYMHIIGMLYTGIGMETIHETQRTLLLQLKVLLNHEMVALSRLKLLKIIVLNIFVLESSLSQDTRCQYALNFCNRIFCCILQKTNGLLTDLNNNLEHHDDEKVFLNLNPLLQFIRIYMMWLSTHVYVWESGKHNEYTSTDYWEKMQQFFQLIKHNNFNLIKEYGVVFEEDVFLAGFSPLSAQLSNKHNNVPSEEHLQFNSRLLCILQYEETIFNKKEVLQSTEHTSERSSHETKIFNMNVEIARQQIPVTVCNEEINDIVKKSTCVNGENLQEELNHLTKLKKNLEAQSNAKEMYSKKLEEILKCANTKIYVEVRPKYLLPDTNCFIDYVEDLENIITKHKYYRLIIPLTVIRELYGLSKGVKFDHMKYSRRKERIYHYDDVSSRAKKALDFITASKNNIKCATTKGSIINASLFSLAEEENVCNDDKILATAVALSKTMSSESNSNDGKCLIRTELILITTDRNLRVKALSRNLTVSELSEFLEWADNYTGYPHPHDDVKETVNERN